MTGKKTELSLFPIFLPIICLPAAFLDPNGSTQISHSPRIVQDAICCGTQQDSILHLTFTDLYIPSPGFHFLKLGKTPTLVVGSSP